MEATEQHIFNNYLLATGGDAHGPARRKTLVLRCLRVEGQRIVYTLSEMHPPIPEPSELPEGQKTPTAPDKYDAALAVIKSYFVATSNMVVARHRFGRRAQLPGESIDAIVAELPNLSSK
ncbi:unnamed protein product [Ixodes pacificus]